jgi:hypothetical protein
MPHIHVFGDSHANWCFSNNGQREYVLDYNNLQIPFSVHWIIGKTMHGVGKDGLQILNLRKYGVQENDVALFTFGEIDARCHIGKQRDEQKRDLNDIIDLLIMRYLETINQNRALYKNIYCMVMEVIPPTDRCNNIQTPFYGTLEDRIAITRLLNKRLRAACLLYNIPFLQTHDIYANQDGSLNHALSDNCVHVGMKHNHLIKKRFIELLLSIY